MRAFASLPPPVQVKLKCTTMKQVNQFADMNLMITQLQFSNKKSGNNKFMHSSRESESVQQKKQEASVVHRIERGGRDSHD